MAEIEPVLPACDFVLVMSVMPGFGGQQFDPVAIDKVRAIKEVAREDVLIEIDGGVNHETIASCVEAGVDMLVVGSAITGQDDYTTSVERLTRLARAEQ